MLCRVREDVVDLGPGQIPGTLDRYVITTRELGLVTIAGDVNQATPESLDITLKSPIRQGTTPQVGDRFFCLIILDLNGTELRRFEPVIEDYEHELHAAAMLSEGGSIHSCDSFPTSREGGGTSEMATLPASGSVQLVSVVTLQEVAPHDHEVGRWEHDGGFSPPYD